MTISRRDFLNGTALAIATGLTPAAQIEARPGNYPPALIGLRGQHDGSFEVAHALSREGRAYPVARLPIEERYDLVVIGAGISGLAAAYFYRRVRPGARVLILDNHDDFGGHAKRNEFFIGGRRLIGYGGSQSLQSPNSLFSPIAKNLLRELGVDITRFETAFERALYPSMGLGRGVFFNREAFGRDVLVVGDRAPASAGEEARRLARPLSEFIAGFPIAAESHAQLLTLYDGGRDPLEGRTVDEKIAILKRTSYRDYLIRICGLSEEAANCLQGRPLGFYGLGSDSIPASEARDLGYPGFAGIKLARAGNPAWQEPYIYHFPDGNAGIARLLVRALIPSVAPGRSMEDVVPASFDYSRLDNARERVRIRLNSTCVQVRNGGGKVQLAYVRHGRLHRIEARHAVLACFHMMIPHMIPELPVEQHAALSKNVKTPIVYTNVLVRNWRAFANLKVHHIHAPMGFHHQVSLDFPVSLGGYRHPRDPSEPMLLHMVHVPGAPMQGLDARAQFRIGQGELYAMTFADFEERIRDDLDRMLGMGDFRSARDIAAITVNRWPHGYSYVANSLFDPENYDATVLPLARQRVGNVGIANTDAGGDSWVHFAIDQAERAVRELLELK